MAKTSTDVAKETSGIPTWIYLISVSADFVLFVGAFAFLIAELKEYSPDTKELLAGGLAFTYGLTNFLTRLAIQESRTKLKLPRPKLVSSFLERKMLENELRIRQIRKELEKE